MGSLKEEREAQLGQLLVVWKRRIDERLVKEQGLPASAFVADGTLDPTAYWLAPAKRVLFVLREPNGEREDDMRERVRKHRSPTWHGMVALARAILGEATLSGRTSQELGLEALGTAALINAKKSKGGGAANPLQLGGHLYGCADLLRRQIELMEPAFVVFPRNPAGYAALLGLPEEPTLSADGHPVSAWKLPGRIYVGTHHPAARGGRAWVDAVGRVVAALA